jgi:hypothetical protein
VTDGKPIAVLLQSISGVIAINPLVDFYDIHGGNREVLFFYFVSDTTRDNTRYLIINYYRPACCTGQNIIGPPLRSINVLEIRFCLKLWLSLLFAYKRQSQQYI